MRLALSVMITVLAVSAQNRLTYPVVVLPNSAHTAAGEIRWVNSTGTHYAAIKAGAMASDITWAWATTDASGPLCSNGSGVLSFNTCSSAPADMMTTDTPQTVTGLKTFAGSSRQQFTLGFNIGGGTSFNWNSSGDVTANALTVNNGGFTGGINSSGDLTVHDALFNGVLSGTHAQNVGTTDSPTFGSPNFTAGLEIAGSTVIDSGGNVFGGNVHAGGGGSFMVGSTIVIDSSANATFSTLQALGSLPPSGTVQAQLFGVGMAPMGTTAGNDYPLARFTTSQPSASVINLGVRAHQVTTGSSWTNVALGLSYDVDVTIGAGGQLWFYQGNIGINKQNPSVALDVNGDIKATNLTVLGSCTGCGSYGANNGVALTGANFHLDSTYSPTFSGLTIAGHADINGSLSLGSEPLTINNTNVVSGQSRIMFLFGGTNIGQLRNDFLGNMILSPGPSANAYISWSDLGTPGTVYFRNTNNWIDTSDNLNVAGSLNAGGQIISSGTGTNFLNGPLDLSGHGITVSTINSLSSGTTTITTGNSGSGFGITDTAAAGSKFVTLTTIGAGQTGSTSGNFDTTGTYAGSISVVDTQSSFGAGGAVVFSTNAGTEQFAAIKGFLTNGASNSQGDIVFSTRTNATDVKLTEAMRIKPAGNVTMNGLVSGVITSNDTITAGGHLLSTATTGPTTTTATCSISAGSTDFRGQLTCSSTPTAVRVVFNGTYGSTPTCLGNNTGTNQVVTSPTTSLVDLTGSASATWHWMCIG